MTHLNEKFDEELLRVLKEREEQCSTELINIILHFEPELDLLELEEMGFKLSRKYELMNIVAGQITPENAYKIAGLSKVTKLEYDSEIHAF